MGKHIWTAVHLLTAFTWMWIAASILLELVTTGEVSRTPTTATRFSAGDAVLFLALSIMTAASAFRAAIQEQSDA